MYEVLVATQAEAERGGEARAAGCRGRKQAKLKT